MLPCSRKGYNMEKIKDIYAMEIVDSRGNPTVFARVTTESGAAGEAAVPSGASTGMFEACELRDNDKSRYLGKGVLKAVGNVNGVIAGLLRGHDVEDQSGIDAGMIEADGTDNKTNLGANAILAVSLAAARAAASYRKVPLYRLLGGDDAAILPVPMMNILNGGAHASNNIDVQEFMIMPVGAPSFGEGLRQCVEVFHTLKGILSKRGLGTSVGDEGGFAPDLDGNGHAIETILSAVEQAGYKPGGDFLLALDTAVSDWFREGVYFTPKSRLRYTRQSLMEHWQSLCAWYPIISIEDPFAEENWEGFKAFTYTNGSKLQIVGDDLFVTNEKRLKKGIEESAANAILIKLNQIGTLTETLNTIRTAQNAGYATIISHRSGETEDTFIADLAVAVGAGQIKTGAPSRSERVAKYNRLLQIERELGGRAAYPGRQAFGRTAR